MFGPDASYIENLATGKRVALEEENGTYIMNVRYVQDGAAAGVQVFSRQR